MPQLPGGATGPKHLAEPLRQPPVVLWPAHLSGETEAQRWGGTCPRGPAGWRQGQDCPPPPASLKSHLLSLHLCGEGVWGPHGFREHVPPVTPQDSCPGPLQAQACPPLSPGALGGGQGLSQAPLRLRLFGGLSAAGALRWQTFPAAPSCSPAPFLPPRLSFPINAHPLRPRHLQRGPVSTPRCGPSQSALSLQAALCPALCPALTAA